MWFINYKNNVYIYEIILRVYIFDKKEKYDIKNFMQFGSLWDFFILKKNQTIIK